MSSSERTEHALINRRAWSRWAEEYREEGRQAWALREPRWGIWGIPEAELRVLPEVNGFDVLELGCGTAYWSAWLACRGARPVGLDQSPEQLESARLFQHEFGLEFPLIEASAESIPIEDEKFDLVFSEYGASEWCDPYLWVPEAARVLRPGGRLIFLKSATLLALCLPQEGPAGERLLRPLFSLHRLEWSDDPSVSFALSHAEWIRLFCECGFAIESLIDVQAPVDGSPGRFVHLTLDWARRWPSEEIWTVEKLA